MKAIGFKPRLASLWHDLGLALLLEAKLRGEGYGQALASLRNAVSLDPQRHGHWNSLGVLALSTGASQFCRSSIVNLYIVINAYTVRT